MIRFPRPAMPESLIYVDVVFGGDTLRVYTTHLQSVQFRKKDYQTIEQIKNRDTGVVESSRNIFSKLKRGVIYRCRQADIVKDFISRSPHPFVLTADFND